MLAIVAFLYYYFTLPAINIHSRDFWFFIGILVAVLALIYAWKKRLRPDEIKTSKGMKAILFVLAAVVVVYLVGALLSSPIVNAKKYQKLLKVEEGEFTKDIEETFPLIKSRCLQRVCNTSRKSKDGKYGRYGISI